MKVREIVLIPFHAVWIYWSHIVDWLYPETPEGDKDFHLDGITYKKPRSKR